MLGECVQNAGQPAHRGVRLEVVTQAAQPVLGDPEATHARPLILPGPAWKPVGDVLKGEKVSCHAVAEGKGVKPKPVLLDPVCSKQQLVTDGCALVG